MSLKVSVSGIRGVIGDTLDAEVATRWASAFGSWLPEGPVVVARDSRPSGPMIATAVTAALLSTGHDVVDGGILTTPSTELLVKRSDAVGGVIVTASHNPVEWNALKLLRDDGLFLNAQQMEGLRETLERGSFRHRSALRLGERHVRHDGEAMHLEAILGLALVDVAAVRDAGLKVVIDCVEGAGGAILPALLAGMGVEVIPLHCGRTGRFPRDPEPRPEHLRELAERVHHERADLGLAVDPDVDRLALVDRGGRLLSEELTLAVVADYVLPRHLGPMVVNLSTTLVIDHVAKKHKVPLHRAPVGEANVVQKMLEEGATLGGEGNGGVILPALHAGRDAVLGSALVLSAVAHAGSLSACLADFPPVSMRKEKLALRAEIDDVDLWRRALAKLGDGGEWNEDDGLKLAFEDRWVHLRRSNTENALRVIAEAPDEETAQAMIDDVRSTLGA